MLAAAFFLLRARRTVLVANDRPDSLQLIFSNGAFWHRLTLVAIALGMLVFVGAGWGELSVCCGSPQQTGLRMTWTGHEARDRT
jgi:hypothetical protein